METRGTATERNKQANSFPRGAVECLSGQLGTRLKDDDNDEKPAGKEETVACRWASHEHCDHDCRFWQPLRDASLCLLDHTLIFSTW